MTKQVMTLTVNGIEKEVCVRNAETLIHTLRHQLGLMGAKPACNNGDCGACTILINGMPINSCHTLTVENQNSYITTIEGLTDTSLQEAFVQHWAIQCGYCTPGFILNCHALLQNKPDATEETVDEWLDSNICRCTGYQEIKALVKGLLKERESYG